jgi:Na+/phosphate symporter
MLSILAPAFVALVGLLIYALSTNPKVSEIGRIAYFCGLFFVVWALFGQRVHLP